jgi:hypothetical protein
MIENRWAMAATPPFTVIASSEATKQSPRIYRGLLFSKMQHYAGRLFRPDEASGLAMTDMIKQIQTCRPTLSLFDVDY